MFFFPVYTPVNNFSSLFLLRKFVKHFGRIFIFLPSFSSFFPSFKLFFFFFETTSWLCSLFQLPFSKTDFLYPFYATESCGFFGFFFFQLFFLYVFILHSFLPRFSFSSLSLFFLFFFIFKVKIKQNKCFFPFLTKRFFFLPFLFYIFAGIFTTYEPYQTKYTHTTYTPICTTSYIYV